MNEPTTPDEDELVTAVLDGEATESERAQVDADPRLRARRDEFAALRHQLAEVTPPPADQRAAMIARAATAHAPAAARESSDDATVLRMDRERRHRRVLTALTVAAVLLVVVPLLAVTLLRGGSETSVDSASGSLAGGQAESADAGAGFNDLAPSVDAPDLGLVTSADQLRVIIGGALQARTSAQANTDRQLSPSSQTTATTGSAPSVGGSQTAIGACASNLAATDPTLGEPLLSATASWKGDPSFVLVFRANDANADPPTDVIIVTTADCTPVERISV